MNRVPRMCALHETLLWLPVDGRYDADRIGPNVFQAWRYPTVSVAALRQSISLIIRGTLFDKVVRVLRVVWDYLDSVVRTFNLGKRLATCSSFDRNTRSSLRYEGNFATRRNCSAARLVLDSSCRLLNLLNVDEVMIRLGK